jgi:hypothetical protein
VFIVVSDPGVGVCSVSTGVVACGASACRFEAEIVALVGSARPGDLVGPVPASRLTLLLGGMGGQQIR